MDTGKIKALATGARVQLMDGVRASLERVLAPDSPESINERNRVNELRNEAKDKEVLIERVAYTWFNRLCALRLMDSRGYMPVPVVTPRAGETMPAILADARRGVFCDDFPLKSEDKQRVTALVTGVTDSVNPLGEAYVILLLSACDYYAKLIPALFGSDPRSTNAMRLLAPTSLLAENSILQRIVEGMDDENCSEVEVMGWLYQYYIAERKDEVFEGFKKHKKAGPEEIKPATQLFTPNWIVRYLVENSLGRLWMLNFPDSDVIDRMDYYIAPNQQESDYLRIEGPEDITFLDPAMGSSHILVYAFDLLYDMYIEEGYRPTEIPKLILEKNLTGFEIDDRAFEIASFALTIKAREKDADYFDHVVAPDLTVFHPIQFTTEELQDAGLIAGHTKLLDALAHLDEIGSLYRPDSADAILLDSASVNLGQIDGLFASYTLGGIAEAKQMLHQLTRRFSIVAANPPYLTSGNMNTWLNDWVRQEYPNEKADFCTCFIRRCLEYASNDGYVGMITASAWMFKSSFIRMREQILSNQAIMSLIQQSTHGYPSVTVPTAMFVMRQSSSMTIGNYIRLEDFDRPQWQEPRALEAINNHECGWFYRADAKTFLDIPDMPFAYWASDNARAVYANNKLLGDIAEPKQGFVTRDNDRFLRLWWEISFDDFELKAFSHDDSRKSDCKWYPCTKGGEYRKWYGNYEYVVNYGHDGEELIGFAGSHIKNRSYYFREGITWSTTGSSVLSMRYLPKGRLFEHKGSTCFTKSHDDLLYLLGFANSSAAMSFLTYIAPTIDFGEGSIGKLPIPMLKDRSGLISEVQQCIDICRSDYDSFETSWDYATHPLLCRSRIIAAADETRQEWENRFNQLKLHEESINRYFAESCGLEHELVTEVQDNKVTARRFSLNREVKSLISYAVGCMFGRYSLDAEGLVLASQESTLEDYIGKIPSPTFMPDGDGILPITEEEWFEDDIVTEFWRWLKSAFGETHFDENLSYIESVLGCKLREYFIKGRTSRFYDDHCKTYAVTNFGKRPIYWMFSSPNSSFNCLIYMHRYDDRTVSKILTDYVRELRRKLEAQARGLEVSDVARDRTRAAKYHDMIDELNDWERDVLYPMAQWHIKIDLDDGVRHNYKLFPGALRKVTGLS